MAGSGMLNPPLWDESRKEFSLWLREVKAWKTATENINGLKNVHGLQLALHLPEGSEIRRHIFDSLETEEMMGSTGWDNVIGILERHFKKDEHAEAFQTWKEFRVLIRKEGQSIDDYILFYEKYKMKMLRYKMDLGERIHGLNLLCGANLSDEDLKIAMREVDHNKPDEIYTAAKNSLKKYFGSSAISNNPTSNPSSVQLIQPKLESCYISSEDYNSYVAWKQSANKNNRRQTYSNSQNKIYNDRYSSPQGQSAKNASSPVNFKKNPNGRDGQPLQCHICRSIAHFARDCPERPGFSKTIQPFITSDIIECDVTNVLASNSFNHMILDTGCPRNVASKLWLDCFLESLNPTVRNDLKKADSSNKYRSGGGTVKESLFKIEIPVLLADEMFKLEFDVIDGDLPLLLGKETMKNLKLIIDTASEVVKVTINKKQKNIELLTSLSGHWCINIQPFLPQIETLSTLFTTDHLTPSQKLHVAEKLHRQYCHPPFEFLKKVLSTFNATDHEFLDILRNYSEKCHVCKRYKPTIPRPVVGNLLNPEKMKFNEIVSIDIKYRNGKLILYMIDVVTRYTRADFIPNKNKETVVNKIIELWVPLFGPAKVFLTDNGGEFANDEMRELGNIFGICIKHTAAYSPWANGVNERNHATIDMMLNKIVEDIPDIDLSVALQYAVSVRNCFLYINGFTPAQLAIGQNPRLPSAMTDALPALDSVTTSPLILEKLNVISAARKAFVELETSKKLRKALKHPIRTFNDNVFQQGDNVYYKLPNQARWEGPAKVIGAESKIVVIKHGSIIRRVHPCNLQFVNQTDKVVPEENGQKSILKSNNEISETSKKMQTTSLLDDTLMNMTNLNHDETQVNKTLKKAIPNLSLPKKNQHILYKTNSEETWKNAKVLGLAGNRKGKYRNWLNITDGKDAWSVDWEDIAEWKYLEDKGNDRRDALQKTMDGGDGSSLSDAIAEDVSVVENVGAVEDVCVVEDVGVVGEVVEHFDVDETVVNVFEDKAEDVFIVLDPHSNYDEFFQAKLNELKKWKEFGVYSEVDDAGQERLTGRWVCNYKLIENVHTPKARYVIKGFQEQSVIQSDSPTGSKESLHLIISIISCKKWTLHTTDIKAAFLQGEHLDRDLYLVPPDEAETKKLWKLRKCVYGLNDAARMWYFAVWNELEKLNCQRSSLDYGVFMYYHDDELCGIFMSHVDDFLWAGTDRFRKYVIEPLYSKFKVGKTSIQSFTYVGINIQQYDNLITIDQVNYINTIKSVTLCRNRQLEKSSFCSPHEITLYQQLVGKLNWVARQSRPDICFDICRLSSVIKKPVIGDIVKANKVLRYIKDNPLVISYPSLHDLSNTKILCYSDASLTNLPSGSSTGGYVIFLEHENICCPIVWKSNTIRRVVRSTLSAESSVMVDALDASYFLSNALEEMIYGKANSNGCFSIIAFTDNKSLYRNVHSTVMANEYRLRIDIAIIKQMLSENELQKLVWIPAELQLADSLMKNGANPLKLAKVFENGSIS